MYEQTSVLEQTDEHSCLLSRNFWTRNMIWCISQILGVYIFAVILILATMIQVSAGTGRDRGWLLPWPWPARCSVLLYKWTAAFRIVQLNLRHNHRGVSPCTHTWWTQHFELSSWRINLTGPWIWWLPCSGGHTLLAVMTDQTWI